MVQQKILIVIAQPNSKNHLFCVNTLTQWETQMAMLKIIGKHFIDINFRVVDLCGNGAITPLIYQMDNLATVAILAKHHTMAISVWTVWFRLIVFHIVIYWNSKM